MLRTKQKRIPVGEEGEHLVIPRVTLERFQALEQAAIGALRRSCIGCAGDVEFHDGSHLSTAGAQLCTADPILRDAIAELVRDADAGPSAEVKEDTSEG